VRVDVPTKLSARAKELLAELQGELEGLNVRVADEEAVSRKVATK